MQIFIKIIYLQDHASNIILNFLKLPNYHFFLYYPLIKYNLINLEIYMAFLYHLRTQMASFELKANHLKID